MKDDFICLGEIKSVVTNGQSISVGVTKENFQANHFIVGSKVYQYGYDIVVHINVKYRLYKFSKENSTSNNSRGLSQK